MSNKYSLELRQKPYFKELHQIWRGIRFRCGDNMGVSAYKRNGIKMCGEWHNDFEAFYKWSMENGYKYEPIKRGNRTMNKYSIDRIDGYGNYEPSNCRWVDWYVQEHNKPKHYYKERKEE